MSPETLCETFEGALAALQRCDPSRSLRGEAMAAFAKHGYPTRKHEDWRYTDLRSIAGGDFDPTPQALTTQHIRRGRELLEASALDGEAARLVFVDGQPLPGERSAEPLRGLAVLGGACAWQRIGALHDPALLTHHPLAALNTAFASSETLIRVDENARVDAPLHLVFITAGAVHRSTQPRILIDMGAGSELTIVQHFFGESADPAWTNPVTQISQDTASRLTLYRYQAHGAEQLHTELLKARLERDAHIKLGYVDVGGRLVRNDVHVDLAAPGGSCELFGVFLASQGRHVDNHTRIDHTARHTTSREAFRGIIGERGRGVFNGKVIVHAGARGADAEQSSDNLLLSERGEIDTKPELEIYTDDVKCAHGATVGELDARQLFYIRSRGLDEATAKGLLTFAFANEVLRRIEIPAIRDRVTASVAGQLPDYESWGGLL